MHRFFVLLLPLAVLAYHRAPEPPSRPVHTPVAVETLMDRLDAALEGQDRDKIQQVCHRILMVQPTHYRAQMTVADLNFQRRDYRKSAGDYARVLLTHPEDAEALSGAAWSAVRLGDLSRAARDFASLLRVSPNYPDAQLGHDIATGKRPDLPERAAAPTPSALAGPVPSVQK